MSATPAGDLHTNSLDQALARKLWQVGMISGQLRLPAVPSLLEAYLELCHTIATAFSLPITAEAEQQLLEQLRNTLDLAFQQSARSWVVMSYEAVIERTITFTIEPFAPPLGTTYDGWVGKSGGQPFGMHADARVLNLASAAADPSQWPVLDLGAGNGRNALALARRGHPVDAVELSGQLAQALRTVTQQERLPIRVLQRDLLASHTDLRRDYRLIVVSGVASDFRGSSELRALMELASSCLTFGGQLLVSLFLARDGYEPSAAARELGLQIYTALFTRSDVAAATANLPLQLVSDLSVHDYEYEHLPAEAWPPTPWYAHWTRGEDLFGEVGVETNPVEMRWLVWEHQGLAEDQASDLPQLEQQQAQRLADAQHWHQQGQPDRARLLYQAMLESNPADAQALHFYGLLNYEQGNLQDALQQFQAAIASDPTEAFFHLNLGNLLKDISQLQEAEHCYRQALTLAPDDALSHYNLGVLQESSGRTQEAISSLEQAVALNPDLTPAWRKLAALGLQQGSSEQALAAAERAIALEPQHAAGWFHQADALSRLDRWADAKAALMQAISLQANFPEAHNNLGLVLKQLGDAEAASQAFALAAQQDPQFADPWCNQAQLELEAGRPQQALGFSSQALQRQPNAPQAHFSQASVLEALGQSPQAAEHLRRALELRPNYPEALNNLGNILLRLQQFESSIASYEQALALQPENSDVFANLGNAHREAKNPDQAEASLLRAIALKPDFAAAHSNLGNAYADQGRLDDAIASYRHAIDLGQTERDFIPNYLFSINYSPNLSDEQLNAEHRRLCAQFFDGLRDLTPFANSPDPERRLRIGYVSPDFWMHPVARFLLPLLEHHNREGFELIAYSSRVLTDGFTEEIAQRVDGWRQVAGLNDDALAQQIRADGIDILIDLTMHARDCRPGLFARKPAPLQISYLAYVGTTGLAAIDYRITDVVLDPPDGPPLPFIEQPLRLPRCWWSWMPPPRTTIPEVVPPPCLQNGFVTFGSLNNFTKVNPPLRALWARLVASLPEARLLLHSKHSYGREALLQELADHGLPRERVTLIGYQDGPDYMGTYGQIDIALDPSPFAGGTTSFDALWMGVPVLTQPGERSASRGGASILTSLGRSEWIAHSDDDLIQRAHALAADPAALATIRAGLRDELRRSPLMDGAGFTQEYEALLRQAWREWCAKAGAAD